MPHTHETQSPNSDAAPLINADMTDDAVHDKVKTFSFLAFINAMMEAHRYVQNRRTLAGQ